jgi:hypothetical protein
MHGIYIGPVHERTEKIRNVINGPILKGKLAKSGKKWMQPCGCLDVLEDTEVAINASSE